MHWFKTAHLVPRKLYQGKLAHGEPWGYSINHALEPPNSSAFNFGGSTDTLNTDAESPSPTPTTPTAGDSDKEAKKRAMAERTKPTTIQAPLLTCK